MVVLDFIPTFQTGSFSLMSLDRSKFKYDLWCKGACAIDQITSYFKADQTNQTRCTIV